MSCDLRAFRQVTVFHFLSDPERTVKISGNCLEQLRMPVDGRLRLISSDGKARMLVNFADVSYAEVVYE